jgi:hypothetical protein
MVSFMGNRPIVSIFPVDVPFRASPTAHIGRISLSIELLKRL